jgi:hypothetical protein
MSDTQQIETETSPEPPAESTDAPDTSWMDAMPTVVLPWLSTTTGAADDGGSSSSAPGDVSSWMDELPEAQPTQAMLILREEAERVASSDKRQDAAP